MLKALPTTKQESRVEALHEFFGNERADHIESAARVCAEALEKFPTPGAFGAVLRRLKPAPKSTEKAKCDKCDGYGWVIDMGEDHYRYAYRGACEHGAILSEKIPVWRGVSCPDYTTKSPMTLEQFKKTCEAAILQDPEKFARGFVKTGQLLKKISPEKYEWTRKYLFELLGPTRAKRIAEEAANSNAI